ncbi:MAG: cell division protein FtsZ [Treponema sp.]|jgi:cell division protein FtsZ|nr:cell division protein FtsZ [Treponema sp.]
MNVLAVRELSDFSKVQPQVLQFKPQEVSLKTPLRAVAVNEKENFIEQYSKNRNSKYNFSNGAVPAVIKVVSAGGGGANAVNRMISSGMPGVEFIAVNTDIQDLYIKSLAETKVQIGEKITGGWGAGSNPEVGEKAAIEDREAISEVLKGADMVFITAGMGGGTGTGSAPVIAKIAMEQNALTVAVVTTPFDFEAEFKMKQAKEGIAKLKEVVDTIIIIPNQHLFKVIDNKTPYDKAYHKADEVLCRAVQGISECITKTGFLNTDFADVKTIMKGRGDALMGIGLGSGEDRAMDAVKEAIDNPLLEDSSIDGAKGVLINITGPEDMTLVEINNIIKSIKDKCDPEVNLIHGVRKDPEFNNCIQVTVIATGFKSDKLLQLPPVTDRSLDGEYIDLNEYVMNLERKKKVDPFPFLPQRGEYRDDLDIPPVIRKYNLKTEDIPVMELAATV